MRKRHSCLLAFLLATSVLGFGGGTGVCPPLAPPSKVSLEKLPPSQPSPAADGQFVGIVSLLAIVNDKGFVCRAQLIRGLDKEADAKALQIVKRWRFRPAMKNGHPVAVEVKLDVQFSRNTDGQLVEQTPNPDGK